MVCVHYEIKKNGKTVLKTSVITNQLNLQRKTLKVGKEKVAR